MEVVAPGAALDHVRARGGRVYAWPVAVPCCGGRRYRLEAATEAPPGGFRRLAERDGVEVWAACGLARPERLALELHRRRRLAAYWNDQSWI